MPLLSEKVGEKVAGIQVGAGNPSRPSIAFMDDEDTGFAWGGPGIINVISNGVVVGQFPADLGGSPGGSDTQVQYNDSGAFGGDAGFTFNETTNVATLTGGLVSPSVGPAAGQQHTLPGVASDTIALLAASQTLTNKTIGSGSLLSGMSTAAHAIGGSPSSRVGLLVGTDITASGGLAVSFSVAAATLRAAANNDLLMGFGDAGGNFDFNTGTFTGLTAAGFRMAGSNMTKVGTGTIADAATFIIVNAPAIGTNNYALWIAGGDIKFPLGAGTGIVSVNSADTAGTGFRALRVPN